MSVRFARGLWHPATSAIAPAFDQIASYTAAGTGTFTFSSIPGTYKHLQIRTTVKNMLTSASFSLQFNGDTAANYSRHLLDNYPGNATRTLGEVSATSYNALSWTYNVVFPGVSIVDIFDYADTTKNTSITVQGAAENGANIEDTYHQSGIWNATAAVTSITCFSANSIAVGSVFALYGIKGA